MRLGSLAALTAALLLAIGAVVARADPNPKTIEISGADTDIWNAASPSPHYQVTALDDTGASMAAKIHWSVEPPPDGTPMHGEETAPVTLQKQLRGLPDGKYTLTVTLAPPTTGGPTAKRSFRIARVPPRVTILAPLQGAQITLGSAFAAAFSCDRAVSCVGSVANGAALDTSRPGAATFLVTAVDDAGNVTLAHTLYQVVFPPTPAPAGGVARAPGAPVAPTPPVTGNGGPPLLNARIMHPSANALIRTRRPLLRWKSRRGARLYNVQLFRMKDGRAFKVLSVFPRQPWLRVPKGRIAWGASYAWRVWPWVGTAYAPKPLGVSRFNVVTR